MAMNESDYLNQVGELLSSIEAQLDQWLQEDIVDIDSQRSGLMLELTFERGQKVVINAQPPLQELWLASPFGGYHYRWQAGIWASTRGGLPFDQELSLQISRLSGRALSVAGLA
jgi:CyaY protein